jgi:hypothetical protein
MNKKFIVRLSDEERRICQEVVKKLKGSSQKVRRAQILLRADAAGPNWTDKKIAEAFNCRVQTIENLRKRINFCYTPKHGSWLNVAECELSCLTRQCLRDRLIGELIELLQEITAWSDKTNAKQRGIDWQFRIEVRRDFEINRRFSHRFLAFHDIVGANKNTIGVKQFWEELQGNKLEIKRPHREINLGVPTMGIGIWWE